MAQLTEVEIKKLKTRGVYVKEKCDNPECGKPILTPFRFSAPGPKRNSPELVFDTRECRAAVTGIAPVFHREKKERVDSEGKTRSERHASAGYLPQIDKSKVGGLYEDGSAMAILFTTLQDGQWHKCSDLQKMITAKLDGRLYRIRREVPVVGYRFDEDEVKGVVRMVKVKAAAKPQPEPAKKTARRYTKEVE